MVYNRFGPFSSQPEASQPDDKGKLKRSRSREEAPLKRTDSGINLSDVLLKTPETEKKLRSISSPELPPTPLLRSSSERMDLCEEIDPSSFDGIVSKGHEQLFQGNFQEAKDTLSKLQDKPGWILKRLDLIQRLIDAKTPHEGKKTVQEKLAFNLRWALIQQDQEMPKSIRLHAAEVPSIWKKNEQTHHPLESEAILLHGRKIGIAFCQGPRPAMEDAHLATEIIFSIGETEYRGEIFGVFDGHGGRKSVDFVRDNLISVFKSSLSQHNLIELTDEGIYAALRECFIQLDISCENFKDGTTATVAFKIANKIWIANTGDSRGLLSDNGIPIQMSQDAKLAEYRFRKKITKLGGDIIWKKEKTPTHTMQNVQRVQGILSVAGSIGDRYIKGKTGVCCMPPQPQITCYNLQDVRFVLLGCDGFFDVAATQQTVQMVEELRTAGESPEQIAKRLVYSALTSGSTDNITMLLISL